VLVDGELGSRDREVGVRRKVSNLHSPRKEVSWDQFIVGECCICGLGVMDMDCCMS
jgi:hypothetical protein